MSAQKIFLFSMVFLLSACSEQKSETKTYTAIGVAKLISSQNFKKDYSDKKILVEDYVESIDTTFTTAVVKMASNKGDQPQSTLNLQVVDESAKPLILDKSKYPGSLMKLSCHISNDVKSDLDNCVVLEVKFNN